LFLIYGESIKTVSLKIFNRWGEKVFDSQNQFLGWDGTYKGQPQAPGVYVYEAQITFLDNTQTLRTGSITLIR
jgi:gliding motility-associated-like protein